MLEAYKSKNIIVYCRSGRRSKMATKLLKKKNFNVTNLEGGFIAWRKYFSPKQ
jgi:rhodanese-related sulfurtransferase